MNSLFLFSTFKISKYEADFLALTICFEYRQEDQWFRNQRTKKKQNKSRCQQTVINKRQRSLIGQEEICDKRIDVLKKKKTATHE